MNNEKTSDPGHTHPMYCVKCRTMVMISTPKKIMLKSSRHALHGKCPHCSCSTYKLTAKQD